MIKRLFCLTILLGLTLLLPHTAHAAPVISGVTDNTSQYPNGQVPKYSKFEVTFSLSATQYANPYFPFDPTPPPGINPQEGITVDAHFLPPGQTDWGQAKTLPCFYHQPMEELGSGNSLSFVPLGSPQWRCRFAPTLIGTWQYRLSASDAGGNTQSTVSSFIVTDSSAKGFIRTSQTDPHYFEFSDGTPFVTPLINVEQGSPFNTLTKIRQNIQRLGQSKTNFIRWFASGEGANFQVAPYGDDMRINWGFGSSSTTATDVDSAAGKKFSFRPYFYTAQSVPLKTNTRYRLSVRAKITGDRVLRLELGNFGRLDICSASSSFHESQGQTCNSKQDGWHDYAIEAVTTNSVVAGIGIRGLYVSTDAPSPFNQPQTGTILLHSVSLVRDEDGNGHWGSNHLTRPDPDTYNYIDQPSAARLDELFRVSEQMGVYHKLTVFHKNDNILNRFQADGSIGEWYQCSWGRCPNNFYAAENRAARWYENAYTRYFVARWSYSPSLHSVEFNNENDLTTEAYEASFAFARRFKQWNPHPTLMSNSFWGYWVSGFWTDPTNGQLMDYSDKHWYANTNSSNWEVISNTWQDSAQYVNECSRRFDDYRSTYNYTKPIIRGEGGLALTGTEPQHTDIQQDPLGTYFHKKLWAHLGTLGDSCDGEWYPRLFMTCSASDPNCHFPSAQNNLSNMFLAYSQFMENERPHNGRYEKIGTDRTLNQQIVSTNSSGGAIRAWGIKDKATARTLLWVDNITHTWDNVVHNPSAVVPGNTLLTLSGFEAIKAYPVEAWNTSSGTISETFMVTADATGNVSLPITNLTSDIAYKLGDVPPINPTFAPGSESDLDHDQDIDFADYSLLLRSFGPLFSIFDLNRLVSRFGSLL